MLDSTPALALAALLTLPSAALAQDRYEARSTGARSGVVETADREISDDEILPIAVAIQRGEPASRIEVDWQALVERHAGGMASSDADALTLRVLKAAWAPLESDFDRSLRELAAGDTCAEEARSTGTHRTALERALGAGEGATARDVDAAVQSFSALSEALESCEEALNALGDDAQLANVDLQNHLEKIQRLLAMMSSLSKALHDTAMAIIRNIGG